jgi:ribosomal protein S17E
MKEFVREMATKFNDQAGSKFEVRNPKFEKISNDRISNVRNK